MNLIKSILQEYVDDLVRSVLMESGDLTYKGADDKMHVYGDEDGKPCSPFYGARNSEVVWHGEWADPEVYFDYQGEQYILNYYDCEDELEYLFKNYCEDNDIDNPTDNDYVKFAEDGGAEEALLNLTVYMVND